MTYLITQILLCLLAAFLLGLLLGWWLWSRGCEKKIEETIADWRARFERAENDWKAKLAELEGKLQGAKADTGAAKADADLIAKLKDDVEAQTSRADEAEARISALLAQLDEYKTAAEPDDLTRIEGIGPKIQELLYGAKIHTFVVLSKTDVSRLKEILDAAGERFQMHEPKTWPEQAKLAADGRWEELDKLQDLLRGGRED
jgi:predicted flap endonuclease-1-like 5' DNA nuclease